MKVGKESVNTRKNNREKGRVSINPFAMENAMNPKYRFNIKNRAGRSSSMYDVSQNDSIEFKTGGSPIHEAVIQNQPFPLVSHIDSQQSLKSSHDSKNRIDTV